MQGLDWELIQIPLAAGLNQKADDRARRPPQLEIAKEISFDEIGGLQTRLPFAAHAAGALADARRVYQSDNELVAFTKSAVFTLDDSNDAWKSRGEYLAIKAEEAPHFATTDDQRDCDRAELNGVVVFVWQANANTIRMGAIDKLTGSTVMVDTRIDDATRPRLVATSTRVLLFWIDGPTGDLKVYPISVASLPTTNTILSDAVVAVAAANQHYDITRVIGADSVVGAIRMSPTTSYTVFKTTAGGGTTVANKARTCDGPIAVSCTPDGVSVQVIRANGTNIQGDLITISTLVDSAHINKAVGTVSGTPVNQIACAHRSVQDAGQFRCYAFWSALEAPTSTNWTSKYNYVDTGGGLGAQANFVVHMGIASRAFDYDGRVYVWGVFAGSAGYSGSGPVVFGAQIQNIYLLYRDDASLHAKAAPGRAGGFAATTGLLPGVALTAGSTSFSWCCSERRVIELGGAGSTGYAARSPRDITITFDSNEARRVARIGQTLYIANAIGLTQYDGAVLVETGFLVFPWDFALSSQAGTNLPDGSYAYKVSWRWDNGRAERERSTTVLIGMLAIAGGPKAGVVGSCPPLHTTRKLSAVAAPAVEIWRTTINPTADSPFYLVTSNNPADTGLAANEYIANDPTLFSLGTLGDAYTDTDLASKESHPENGDVLESLPPPACTIVVASDTRLFLAGVAGDPHRVWYSRLRNDGEIASFHDALTVDVPPASGDITALAFLNETLVVFRKAAIYALPGDGFDNLGGGRNFGPARLLSSDVGAVNHESVALTPAGLIFKSSKGWYLLNRGWSVEYIGAPVSDYDAETPVAVHVLESRHQVRIVLASRILVFDYLVQQWAEWSTPAGATALGAVVWKGTHGVLTANGIMLEQAAHTALDYGIDVETPWIKIGDLQNQARVGALQILGEYRSACALQIRIAYDYDPTYVDDLLWQVTPTVVGGPLQVRIGPSRQRVQAIKVRITARQAGLGSSATLDTDPGMAPKVALDGGLFWNAILTWDAAGAGGNAGKLDYVITDDPRPIPGPTDVEVRDEQRYDVDAHGWVSAANTIGVAIFNSNTNGVFVDLLQLTINNESDLATVTTPDAAHGADLLAYPGDPTRSQGSFSGGGVTTSPPTGEAIKLTGLALKVGRKRGFKGLPAGQRT